MSHKKYNFSYDKVAIEMSKDFDVCPFCHKMVLNIHDHIRNDIECNTQYLSWKDKLHYDKPPKFLFQNHQRKNEKNEAIPMNHHSDLSCIGCKKSFPDLKCLTRHINTTPS